MLISQLTQAFKAVNAGLTLIDYFKIRLGAELANKPKAAQAPLADVYSEFQQNILAVLSAVTKSATKDVVAQGSLKRINACAGQAKEFISQLRNAPADSRTMKAHIRICDALKSEFSKMFSELA
jgi:hypothetical protein